MARGARILPAAVLAGLLTACGGDGLPGRGYLPPSTVTATGDVPLTVPPGYGLKPEGGEASGAIERGAPRPAAVLGTTAGEQALLSRAGAAAANPAIRATLNRENALLVGDEALVERLLFGAVPPAGGEAPTEIAIEAPDGEASWLDDAWESLGH